MSWPHPLDHEWRVFGNYFKLCYDVRDPTTGEIKEGCWPNAGGIWGPRGKRYGAGECEVRISKMHPVGGVQLCPETIQHIHEMYGPPETVNGER